MFRGRGGSSRGRGGAAGGSSREIKGLFADGVWHCDCTPRLPAQRFQVKKESKNKGRWFYTCQKTENKRCGFFLWEDEAKPREESAVLSNSRSEPAPKPQHTQPPPVTRKRSRESSDEYGGDEFGNDELRVLSKAADTPHKAIKTTDFTTPSRRKLPWMTDAEHHDLGLPTPETNRTLKQPIFTPSKPANQTAPITPNTGSTSLYPDLNLDNPSRNVNTPTPIRFTDIPTTTSDTSPSSDPDLTTEVLTLIRQSHLTLPPAVQSSLTSILSKHTMRTQGIIKGREISRLALKAKDAKIAELQSRIASLEAEYEAERAESRFREWSQKTAGEGAGG